MKLVTPLRAADVRKLRIYDQVEIYGAIYAGRDAVLPKIVRLLADGCLSSWGIDLAGSVVFHTAVSPAGIGPTSSNKAEIESSLPALSAAGVRLHLGKGALSPETVKALREYGSVYAVTPPVSALLTSRVVSQRVVAFPEEGMEAFYELVVEGLPAIVAIAHGESIFARNAGEGEQGVGGGGSGRRRGGDRS